MKRTALPLFRKTLQLALLVITTILHVYANKYRSGRAHAELSPNLGDGRDQAAAA
jgi:hypothetical protein